MNTLSITLKYVPNDVAFAINMDQNTKIPQSINKVTVISVHVYKTGIEYDVEDNDGEWGDAVKELFPDVVSAAKQFELLQKQARTKI